MGETGGSGRIPRFVGFAIACIISVFPERFSGENLMMRQIRDQGG
jgi:hypothetical protein